MRHHGATFQGDSVKITRSAVRKISISWRLFLPTFAEVKCRSLRQHLIETRRIDMNENSLRPRDNGEDSLEQKPHDPCSISCLVIRDFIREAKIIKICWTSFRAWATLPLSMPCCSNFKNPGSVPQRQQKNGAGALVVHLTGC
jgi:hypothetical protein